MELLAPSHWHCVDFISDLHLQVGDAQTFAAWKTYLAHTAADAVFILGDLFEVWLGDDVLAQRSGFEHQCAEVLHHTATRLDIYIMQGNRDFLMGAALMQACGSTLLDDPSVLVFGGQRWLLTHGDALCLDDTEYMQFRAQVRNPSWQQDFLNQPLSQRLELARHMRAQSEARKHSGVTYADVDTPAALACLHTLHANHMLHGHTHRPGLHTMAPGHERIVLSDWDLNAQPPRSEVVRLRLQHNEPSHTVAVQRISPAANAYVIAANSAD